MKKYRYWGDRYRVLELLTKDAISTTGIKTFNFSTEWGVGFSNGKTGNDRRRTAVRFFDKTKQEPPEFITQEEIDKHRDVLKERGFLHE